MLHLALTFNLNLYCVFSKLSEGVLLGTLGLPLDVPLGLFLLVLGIVHDGCHELLVNEGVERGELLGLLGLQPKVLKRSCRARAKYTGEVTCEDLAPGELVKVLLEVGLG